MPSDAVDHPLALFFDQTNKVLLATFSGVFTRQITIDLDTAGRATQVPIKTPFRDAAWTGTIPSTGDWRVE